MTFLLAIAAMIIASEGISSVPLAFLAPLILLEGAFVVLRARGQNRAWLLERPQDLRRADDDLKEPGNPAMKGFGLHAWMRGGRS
jgi:hypothetical protein